MSAGSISPGPAGSSPELGDPRQIHADLFSADRAPRRLRLVPVINLAIVSALALAFVVSVDIYAVAQGRIEPDGRGKIVQSTGTGKVKTIGVSNGSHVRAGDLLVELDAVTSTTAPDGISAQLDGVNAEIARRTALRASVTMKGPIKPWQRLSFDRPVSALAQERARQMYEAELTYLATSLSAMESGIQENSAHQQSLNLAIAAQRELVKTLEERAVQRQDLASGSNVVNADAALSKEQKNLASLEGRLLSARVAGEKLRRTKADAIETFVADNSKGLADAQLAREQFTKRLIKASNDEHATRLVAPIDGTVHQLAITAVGQVVSSGQRLMMVVPDDAALIVEALMPNRDANLVRPGQQAILSIDSLPSSTYGTISGRVSQIEKGAVGGQEAVLSARPVENPPVSSAFEPLNVAYPITVTLDRVFVQKDGRKIPLMAGMTAQVRICTGRRRIISYLFGPLRDHER